MTLQLTKAQIDAIKVELAKVGLDVRPMPKPRANGEIKGEGSPGKRPAWWHGTGSGTTRKLIAKFGPWREAKGARRYVNMTTGIFFPCLSNDPKAIASHYARSAKGHLRRVTPGRLLLGASIEAKIAGWAWRDETRQEARDRQAALDAHYRRGASLLAPATSARSRGRLLVLLEH